MQTAAWLLIALSALWLLIAPQMMRANAAADANPGVILQHGHHLPATAIPGHVIPRLAPCGYFLGHHPCRLATAALLHARYDSPDSPAAVSVAWNTAFFAHAPDAGHARPPRYFSVPHYLRTARLLI